MDKYYPFPCDKCGMCCQYVKYVEELSQYDIGDGTCKFLMEDNSCRIYYKRPNVCNGKYVYEKYFSHMTVDDYHKMMVEYCRKIKEEIFGERLSKDVSRNR